MRRKTFTVWNTEKEMWEDSNLTIDEAFPTQSWWSKLWNFLKEVLK